jgi:catechol 2,3-dioxygenase-like lactoylglutathione lyase family enzyme
MLPDVTRNSASKAINHLNIITRDLDSVTEFFEENFGFKAGPRTTLKGAWLDELTGFPDAHAEFVPLTPPDKCANATVIALATYVNPPSPEPSPSDAVLNVPGYRHIGFDVDDIDAVHEKLKADWKFFSPPVLVEAMNIKTVYFLGPENIVIQLTQSLGTTHEE